MDSRDALFAELAAMKPRARARFLQELPEFYCAKCGGDLQNGRCTCEGGTTLVTFHPGGEVTARRPGRPR